MKHTKSKNLKLGIPYMGSKRKLSKEIVDTILYNHPKTKYVYDLFGGGGAISLDFLQRKQIEQVTYNDLNEGVVNLFRKIQKDGVTDEFYEWVSRETFKEYKDKSCWKAGLIKTCWSFGNNKDTITQIVFLETREETEQFLLLIFFLYDVTNWFKICSEHCCF